MRVNICGLEDLKSKTVTRLRLIVLAAFVLFITFEAYMHQVKGGGPDGSSSIHALCPYGGFESLFSLFTTGAFIDKIYAGTMVLFAISVVLALLFRRGFCGWICPLGGLQEFFARAGHKIMGKQLVMPIKADKYLRYLKYAVLALTAYFSWKTASMWVSPYDPWAAYGHLGEGLPSVWNEFAIGLIILVISFAGSFFYDRFFCKYLCPMGGFLGLVSKISPFRITRDKDICIDCNLCTKACPVNIDVAKADSVTTAECINCQECTTICPKEGALTNRFLMFPKASIKPLIIGLSILAIYFGSIGIAKIVGVYSVLPGPVSIDTVITDVETLKGFMTLEEISTAMGLSLDEVYRRLEIPENVPTDTKAKELGNFIDGFDFHEGRDKLK